MRQLMAEPETRPGQQRIEGIRSMNVKKQFESVRTFDSREMVCVQSRLRLWWLVWWKGMRVAHRTDRYELGLLGQIRPVRCWWLHQPQGM